MLDDLRDLAADKVSFPTMVRMRDEYRVQLTLAEATATLDAARLYHDHVLTELWDALNAGGEPSHEQRAALAFMATHVAQRTHEVAEAVCDAVGAQAIYRTSPFERRRRDLATIAAHVFGQRKTAAGATVLLFGDDPPVSVV